MGKRCCTFRIHGSVQTIVHKSICKVKFLLALSPLSLARAVSLSFSICLSVLHRQCIAVSWSKCLVIVFCDLDFEGFSCILDLPTMCASLAATAYLALDLMARYCIYVLLTSLLVGELHQLPTFGDRKHKHFRLNCRNKQPGLNRFLIYISDWSLSGTAFGSGLAQFLT